MSAGCGRRRRAGAGAQESLFDARAAYSGLGIAGLPPATLQHAHRFLTLLPTWLPMPETRRHGHGQVALEWSGNDARRFSVLIGQDGMLIYSARLGPKGRLDGAEPIRQPAVAHRHPRHPATAGLTPAGAGCAVRVPPLPAWPAALPARGRGNAILRVSDDDRCAEADPTMSH